jgi:hypothetical protein
VRTARFIFNRLVKVIGRLISERLKNKECQLGQVLLSGFGGKIVIFFILLGICFSGGVAEDVLAGIVERGERGLKCSAPS